MFPFQLSHYVYTNNVKAKETVPDTILTSTELEPRPPVVYLLGLGLLLIFRIVIKHTDSDSSLRSSQQRLHYQLPTSIGTIDCDLRVRQLITSARRDYTSKETFQTIRVTRV